jgi:hypothetical protein
MSPNEHQLRAALRQGEGDRPDADVIIFSARAARVARRRTAWAVVGSVAAVLLVGGGITALSLAGDGSGSSASSGAAAGGASAPAPAPANRPPGTGNTLPGSTKQTAPACPRVLPSVSHAPTRSSGRLFPDGVIAIRICLYPVGSSALNATNELTAAAAQRLVEQLEGSPKPAPQTACTADLGPTMLLLGRTATGDVPGVVGNLGGCGAVSNGTAVRLARPVLEEQAHIILPRLGTPGLNTPGPGPS